VCGTQPKRMDDALLGQLEHGPLYRFSEYSTLRGVIPRSGAGVYTIWDDAGGFLYVGIAGKSKSPKGKGLSGRLEAHASGGRSGDQFCVYVADHYVLPELTREQIEAIRDFRLSMDALVRDKIRTAFLFRFVFIDDVLSAFRLEMMIKGGGLSVGPPLLNPLRRTTSR
jgi:hypothetical protein